MKKITAFFMALFPFLVIGILFATGLITKDFREVTVQRLEMKSDTIKVQKTTDDAMEYSVGSNVRVIPDIARDPTVYWTSEDESIASIEKETGKATIKELGYGEVKLHAVAKTNSSAKADCTLKVWDDRIHKIEVTNAQQAQFVSPGSQLLLLTKTIPSENIKNPNLKYTISGAEHISIDEHTGLLTVGAKASNGEQATVTIETESEPKVTATVDVKVNNSVDTIGFKDDGNLLIQEGTYNLYDQVVTAPYTQQLPTNYFEFVSSDESQAKISPEGIITFQQGYIPGSYVKFTVKFAGLDSISCSKYIASSMNYYSNVSFDDGYAKNVVVGSLANGQDITDQVKFSTYPKIGDENKISLTSSNPAVVEVSGKKLTAKSAGKATITVQAKITDSSVISDSIDVTILTDASAVLDKTELDIGNTNYYPLRKSLNSLFANKQITWTMDATDAAELDTTNESVYFKKTGSCIVHAQYTEGSLTKTSTITLKCNNATTKTVAIDATAEAPKIEVGQVFSLTEAGSVVSITEPAKFNFIDLGSNKYIAKYGCGDTPFNITTSTSKSYNLIVSQDVVSIIASADWSHFTTNATKVEVAKELTIYPANATYIKTSILGSETPYKPEIEFKYTPEDESAVDIGEDYSLTFNKKTTVAIAATVQDINLNFAVTSYCGANGKFSLTNNGTPISSGSSVTLNPSETQTYKIDKFYLSGIGALSEEIKKFSIKSLSDEKIVETSKTNDDNYIYFTLKGVSNGTDTVEISNGSYTFYIYVTVNKQITNVDLYCLGNKLTKYTDESKTIIQAYSTEDLILNMDFSPVVSRDEKLLVQFNSCEEFETLPGALNISDDSTGKKHFVWDSSNENTLTIKRASDSSLLGTYKFKVNTAKPDFSIKDTHEVSGVQYYYLPAKPDYMVMEIEVANSVFNQEYFSKNFTVWDGAKIYGKYIVAPSPAAGASKEVTISNGTEHKYTVKRDMVNRIELPKHNNLDSSDAKGLQRVHVFGTETQYANETKSDVYRLPITVYDYQDHEITDLATKKTAMASLVQPASQGIAEAKYNETTGFMDIKFKKDEANVYSALEMQNNAFADAETNKNQLFTIYTEYGQYHITEKCSAFYSFVVVNGINVYDQKGIEDAIKLAQDQRNIVLQINFGYAGETETTPFTLTENFHVNDLYGNGYGINFDAFTKAHPAPCGSTGSIYAHHAFNTQFVGCNADTFENLTDRSCTWAEGGINTEQTQDVFAYCTFTRYFQVFTIWSAETETDYYYIYIKNCMFTNSAEKCRVALSISNPKCIATVENCALFNSSKLGMLVNKEATVRLKGDIDVYNFHGQDMFDALGQGEVVSKAAWEFALPRLEQVNLVQGKEYGATQTKVVNAYLFTALTGYVQFYDHTDATGKDVYVDAQHGTEKAANYLKYGVGVRILGIDLADIWSTVVPPLPLQLGHSPAYSDEFVNSGEHFNYTTYNLLLEKLSRW